jgi:calcium-dependent protein kinase
MITKSSLIGQYIKDINEHYDFVKELGAGTYGSVWRVVKRSTKETFACKKLNKFKIKNKEIFKTEIDLLRATDHPNIIKLFEIFEDNINLYLIMEECHGGDFFARLKQKSAQNVFYSEKEAAKIFKSLMSAINYCHSHGVCHRDIKPENIMFSSASDDDSLKLIDFGLSKILSNDNKMNSIVGTIYYMAPEVLQMNYEEKCDVWSAGVILYIMLCGKPPFFGKTDSETAQKIIKMDYNLNSKEWKRISKGAKDLISNIFVKNVDRLSSQEVLDTDWVSKLAPDSKAELISLNLTHLFDYTKLITAHKYVINYVTYRLKDEDINELILLFKHIDKNSDGVITFTEFRESLTAVANKNDLEIEINDKFINDLYDEIDVDHNQLINFNEFVSALLNYKFTKKAEKIYDVFKSFDLRNDGMVTLDSIIDVHKPKTNEELETLRGCFDKYDLNKDGVIQFEEFIKGLELYESENLEQYKNLLL